MPRLTRLALLLTLLAAPLALGRGGGGQNYSSPSRSSSSSSSGSRSSSSGSRSGSSSWSGSSGSRSYSGGSSGGYSGSYSGSSSGPRASDTASGFCCVLFLIIIVVIIIVVASRRQKKEDKRSELDEAQRRTSLSPERVMELVEKLRAKDPAFDLQQFHGYVKHVFTLLQDAWFKQDLTPIRPYLSDATFQRFAVQLQLMSMQGVRNALADLKVDDVQLIGLEQSEWFDVAHVRIDASLRDTDVPASASEEEALAAARRQPEEPFVEVWSFVRRPGAQTRAEGLAQGKCPNCGAPFDGGASNNCQYCGAIVNSGNYSWTLAEITQGIEYGRETDSGMMMGLPVLRETDPALNLQVFEDRASLVFWKWVEAQSRGEPGRLAKVSAPEVVSNLQAELEQLRQGGRHPVFLDCAVGAVMARRFHRSPDGFDVGEVEILWSARMGAAPLQGPVPDFPMSPQRWMFTLRRKAGATTQASHGMSTNRCPSCNAPLTDTLSPSCDYCGTVLSGGDRDWVVAATTPLPTGGG